MVETMSHVIRQFCSPGLGVQVKKTLRNHDARVTIR